MQQTKNKTLPRLLGTKSKLLMSCISESEFYRIYRKEPVHREIDRKFTPTNNWHNFVFGSIYDRDSSLSVAGLLA